MNALRAATAPLLAFLMACGSDGNVDAATSTGNGTFTGAGGSSTQGATASTASAGGADVTSADSATATTSASTGGSDPCGGCPSGMTCGTANSLPVCRATTGVPAFSHVFVIVMENLSLSSLQGDLAYAPNIDKLMSTRASGSDYHGVTHPSLPNYIALTSGDPQGITCDCKPDPKEGSCNALTCSKLLGACGCNRNVDNIGDQLEAAGLSWLGLGEDMGTPCNLVSSGNYAARHVPFLYYDSIRNDAARCKAHVVDYSKLDLSKNAPALQFIAPNLVSDMHDPLVSIHGHKTNVENGDAWLGVAVDAILKSDAYTSGGLLIVVWDENDFSGALGADDAIPILVMSPYAKSGGYVSLETANHYALLATIEDAFGLPRLGGAKTATPLTDYFPSK